MTHQPAASANPDPDRTEFQMTLLVERAAGDSPSPHAQGAAGYRSAGRPAQAGPVLVRRALKTPIGSLVLVASPAGLRAVLWPGEDGSRASRAVAGVIEADTSPSPATSDTGVLSRAEGDAAAGVRAAWAHLDQAEAELAEYFAGTRREFDVALDPAGTPFQVSAWAVLRTIPFGSTMSYGQQAAALGDPAKARAVGAANGRNPISIIVPCHRVVASTGALTGFAGGLDTKAWLLEHERRVLAGGEGPTRR